MPRRPESESSREHLAEARDSVQRQIEILESDANLWGWRSNSGGALAELRYVLGELNDKLGEPRAGETDVTPIESQPRPVGKRHLQRGDVRAILLLAAFGLILLFGTVFITSFSRPGGYFNWGFDGNWTCTDQSVDVSCLRKP